jgi:hypothetical protein
MVEAQPPTACKSRLPGSGPNTVELPRLQVAHKFQPNSQQEVGRRMAESRKPQRSSRPKPPAGWRPVQCSRRPRQQASCAPPPSSRPEPAAGWQPVQCSRRSHQQTSCAPPPSSRPEPAAGWRPVQCSRRPRQQALGPVARCSFSRGIGVDFLEQPHKTGF